MTTIGAITGPAPQTSSSALGALGGDAFLQLLVAQLRFQNPMSPTDPSAMLQQTAQFTQVETLQQIAKAQQEVTGLQHTAMATALVGKEVTATAADGQTVQGVVDAVRFTAQGPVLRIGTTEAPLLSASEIRTPSSAAPTAPSASSGLI